MSFRIGKCSSCAATYKLPASFEADRAKCKQCGGVVEIGKAGEAEPAAAAPPVPAKKPAGATAPAPKPAKKRDGPTMKEKLLARREAEEAKAAAAPRKPVQSKPSPKPAAKAPAAKAAAKPRAAAAKTAAAKPVAKAAGGATGSRRSRPAGSRARGGRGKGDDEEDEGGGRRGRRAPQKKGMPVGGMIALVVMVLALGGGGFYMFGMDKSAEAGDGGEGGEPSLTDVTNGMEDDAGNGMEDAGTDLADATEGTEDAGDDAGDSDAADATDEDAGDGAEAAAAAKPPKKSALTDPDSIDLSLIADFGAIAGTSDSRFAELEELVAQMTDPMAGAAGNRARVKLVEAGKAAMPVIINALKTLDLTDDDQFRSADVCQKTLEEICNGNNFGWKYPSQEPEKFHAFDKKVIRSWAQAWEKAETDDAYWAKLAKLDKVEAPADAPLDEDAIDDALDGLDDF